ncbi:thioredoxin [Cohnella nanjingensis]|uniref:Thioredoxin n=1 Tax=Cohnella nanjingensis TaxID=1387779 RepID=A0A7X0VDR3_9BACL|nr:thioredoxin [Cohnella nanjingensis]MBB6669503.1 thioredoxin [Cohnella nanjingensis]
MTIQHTTDSTFQSDLQSEGFTIVNFWAPWCGPCRMFAPILEAFDQEGRAKIVKVNVDENAETAARFGVMSIPATILFKNGKAIDKEIGYLPVEGLRQFVARNL